MAAPRKPPDPPQSESLTAYERWELPVMAEAQRQRRMAVALAAGAPPATPAKRPEGARAPRPPTAAELESIREAAYREGLEQGQQEGFAQGRGEGLIQGQEEGRKKGLAEGQKKGQELALKTHGDKIVRQLQQLDSILQALSRPLEQQRDAMEQALLHLVVAVARAVTFKELSRPSAHILEVIRAAIQALPDTASAIRVFVHPEDLNFIRGQVGAVDKSWTLVADAQLAVGGCRVENSQSVIDFTCDKRFQTVVDQLLARQRDPAPAVVDQPVPVSQPAGEEAAAAAEGNRKAANVEGAGEAPPPLHAPARKDSTAPSAAPTAASSVTPSTTSPADPQSNRQ